jgi:RHS repeat-associated protein
MLALAKTEPRASSTPLALAPKATPVSVTWPCGHEDGIEAFTGREWDPETGFYYYRARYYDPKVGRFISEDPIGLAGGSNSYTYANGRPVFFSDPTGLAASTGGVDCAKVCADAYVNPKHDSMGGGVTCLKGQACPCVFDTVVKNKSGKTILSIMKGECPERDKIVEEHERGHCSDTDCSNSDRPRRGGPKGGFTKPGECEQRRNEVARLAVAALAPGTSRNCAEKMFALSQLQNLWVGAECGR